jgi:membrane protein YqaA with SNARE-associated domain
LPLLSVNIFSTCAAAWCRVMKPESRQKIINVAIIVIVIALSIALYFFKDQVRLLGNLGYVGLFLIGLISNASIIAPVPGLIILFTISVILNPFWSAVIYAIGSGLGELTGYLVGFSGKGIIEHQKYYPRLESWMKKYGGFTIVFLALVPNFLFDVAGLVAGALKMPWYRFLLFVWLGRIPRCLLITYGGSSVLKFFGLG